MSNIIHYSLEVLGSSPTEINHIAARLVQPSPELVNRVSERFGKPPGEVAENLKTLLEFEVTEDPHNSGKARDFALSFKDPFTGIVDGHLLEVSEAAPAAIFLLTYYEMQSSYSGKQVIRAGEVVQQIHDREQKAQGLDWVLLDIFAPYKTEYYAELEFGSLWQQWLNDVRSVTEDLAARV
jgi:hypothetical protein